MGNETPEQTADRLSNAALTTFAAFGESLKGAGTNFQEFQSIQADAQTLDHLGTMAAENIRKLREDQTQPEEMRARRIAAIEVNADQLIGDLRVAVLKKMERLEGQLMQEIKPAPQTDTGKSLLARQELEMLIAGQSNRPMLATLMDLAVSNPEHGAEIMGSWGAAQMAKAGEHRFVNDLQKNVARTLARVRTANDTPRSLAIKAALVALPRVKGNTDGFYHAAKFRLEGSKAKPGPSPRHLVDTMYPKSSSDFQSKVQQKG
jgi:hypothetical protein